MIQPLILAAGFGSRMGRIKALLPVAGTPALSCILATLGNAGLPDPIVVLGYGEKSVRAKVDLRRCTVVVNAHPEAGLSESMKLGLGAVSPSADGVLLFHGDMPYVAASTIEKVVRSLQADTRIAAPFYHDQRGFPVFFRYDQLAPLRLSLQGDRGGARFLATHREAMMRIQVQDPGCVRDLDVPADLEAWEGVPECVS